MGSALKPSSPRIYQRQGAPKLWLVADPWGHFTDISGNGDVATNAGGVTADAGPSGPVLAFDGSTSYAYGPDSGLPSGNVPRTILFSLNTTFNNSGDYYLFSYGGSTAGAGLMVGIYNFGYPIFTQQGAALVANQRVNDGRWHRVAVTTIPVPESANSTVAFYIDGVFSTSNQEYVNTVPGGAVSLNIGRANHYGGPPGHYLPCGLDDVRVYPRALSPAEVARDSADPWWRLRPPARRERYAAQAAALGGPVIGSRVVGSRIIRRVRRSA